MSIPQAILTTAVSVDLIVRQELYVSRVSVSVLEAIKSVAVGV